MFVGSENDAIDLLARLEAENVSLRQRVVDLALELLILRGNDVDEVELAAIGEPDLELAPYREQVYATSLGEPAGSG